MVKRTQEPQDRRAGYVVDVPAAAADPTEHRRGHRRDHRHVGKVKVHRGVDDGLERDAARLAREPDRPRAGGAVERARARAVKAAAALPAEGREERLPRIGTTAAAQSLLGNFTLGVSPSVGGLTASRISVHPELLPERWCARSPLPPVPGSIPAGSEPPPPKDPEFPSARLRSDDLLADFCDPKDPNDPSDSPPPRRPSPPSYPAKNSAGAAGV